MSKKKIAALIIAGIMTVGVVGGTLAWFTSEDSVTNVFNTGTTSGDRVDAGIKVDENFPGDTNKDKIYDKAVLPGDTMTKEVWVESTANYDQFLRAKIVKNWIVNKVQNGNEDKGIPALEGGSKVTHYKQVDGKVVYGYFGEKDPMTFDWNVLDYEKIRLEFDDNNFGDTKNTNKWYAPTENGKPVNTDTSISGYFYYNQVLQEKDYDETKNEIGVNATDKTADLFKVVTFVADETVGNENVDNFYRGLTFEVKVEAEGIQASHGAAQDSEWRIDVPVAKIDGYMTEAQN